MLVFGTRPEAIKMAPLVKEFKSRKVDFDVCVCVTAQHRQMLDQVLDFFDIIPDYDLNLMKQNQSLNSLTSDILLGMKPILAEYNPDYVFVHGDTATSMAVALAAYYAQCKVVHIEAGLRTFNKWSPYPEEMNRQITSKLADIHFAPTMQSRQNLLNEGVSDNNIVVVGNTVIDALYFSVDRVSSVDFTNDEIKSLKNIIDPQKELILVTGHRRENFGQGFIDICSALKSIIEANSDVQIIYPVHLNPNVQQPVSDILSNIPNISLVPPLSYPSFVWAMNKAKIIITDSGGVQEEAPSLGKPVLVMRDTTERPEAVLAGTVLLVGTDRKKIVEEALDLLRNTDRYVRMSTLHNPYGDGKSSKKIIDFLSDIKE